MKLWNKIFYYYLPAFLLVLSQLIASVLFAKLNIIYFKSFTISFFFFSVPVVLLYYIIFALIKLFLELHHGKIGSQFQAKLLGYFLIIILLLIIPAIIAVNQFFGQTFNTWFLSDVKIALDSSIHISQMYKQQYEKKLVQAGNAIYNKIFSAGYSEKSILLIQNKYKLSYYKIYKNDSLVFYYSTDKNVYNMISLRDIKSYKSDKPYIIFSKQHQKKFYLFLMRRIRQKNTYIVLGIKLPSNIATELQNIEKGYSLYSQLSLFKKPLHFVLFLIFFDFFLVLFFIATVLSILFAKQISKPILLLYEATKNISSGQYNFLIPSDKSPDLKILINSFNSMLKELAFNQKTVFHAKHIEAWKNLTLRHLTALKQIMKNTLEVFSDYKNKKNNGLDSENDLELLNHNLKELFLKIEEISSFSQSPTKILKKEDLNDIIRNVMEMFEGVIGNISFYVELDGSLPLIGLEREQIHQIFVNLLKNSIEAIPKNKKGLIKIRTYHKEEFSHSYIFVELIDNGLGIPKDLLDNIFEPYFTTKKNKQGLGLVIVKKVLSEHKASIQYKRVDGKSIFTIKFEI